MKVKNFLVWKRRTAWALAVIAALLVVTIAQAADGDLDTSFGTGGIVTTDFGAADAAHGVAIQTDGRIVVAGTSNNDFALARYNNNGTLDTNFNATGMLTTDISGAGSADQAFGLVALPIIENLMCINGVPPECEWILLRSGGEIIVVGASGGDFAVARYSNDGSLDTTFNTTGIVTTDLGGTDFAYAVAIQVDGMIVVGGTSDSDFALTRYNSNGTLDPNFGNNGIVTTDFNSSTDNLYAIAIQPGGKIVVAGDSNASGNYDFALARYNSDGSLDTTFGTNGKVTTSFGSGDDNGSGMQLQKDGKIVVVGDTFDGTYYDFAVARYDFDGALDATFSGDGKVVTSVSTSNDFGLAAAVQADGKIIAGGFARNATDRDFALVRYNKDGTLDTTFSSSGMVTTAIGSSDDRVNSVAIQTDGAIVAVGQSNNGADEDFALARYDAMPVAVKQVGLVSNTDGVNDLNFNYMAYQGLLQAESHLNVVGTLYQPTSDTAYQSTLEQCADDGNGLCLAVGFSMADAVNAAAAAKPGTNFAILDYAFDAPSSNLRGMVFNEKQVGYLAGALAGKMTSTGTIGAVGGMQIPPVIAFLEGYQNGAQCSRGTINVLMNYTGTFSDPTLGANVAADMISRNADVIFGAAGFTGNGAILYSAQHGKWSIGVDADQYLTVFGNGTVSGSDKLLSSAMKRLDTAAYDTIQDYVNDTFTSGTITYDLAANGVGLAPFHETDAGIAPAIKTYLDTVKADIISGAININYGCNPRFHAEIVENDVQGYDWWNGQTVTLKIDDPANGASWDVTKTSVVDAYGTVTFSDLGGLQLAPGMIVQMIGDLPQVSGKTKTHVVTDLKVTGIDPVTDTVSGTGEYGSGTPQRNFNIQHCDDSGCSWRRWVALQADDTWKADFSIVGSGGDEQQILNIVPGTVGEALEPDEDGDHTDYQWYVPNPQITANPVSEWIQARDRFVWKTGTLLTLNVNDPATPANPDYGPVQVTVSTPWNPNDPVGFFEITGYNLKAGDEVTISGGTSLLGPVSKSMTVSTFHLTASNLALDTLSGLATPNAPVDVFTNGGAATRHLTANGSGAWIADFAHVGTRSDEQTLADLVANTNGGAQEMNANGDYTFVDWNATATISGNAGVAGATITYTGGTTTASSNGNYSFAVQLGWSGTVMPSKAGYAFTPISRTYSGVTANWNAQNYIALPKLTVTKTGLGSGTVTSSPVGINCGATCSKAFNSGTVVTLTAAPATGSVFAGWGGACTGLSTCKVTMTVARSVTATFKKEYTLNGGFNTYTGTSKIPTSWMPVNLVTASGDGKDTFNKKEGLASVKIVGATGKTKILTQTIKISPVAGKSFTFSFWVKGTIPSTTGSCMGQVLFYNGSTLLASQTKTLNCLPASSTVFQQKTTALFSVAGAYTSAKVVFTYSKATGTVWFDWVSLVR